MTGVVDGCGQVAHGVVDGVGQVTMMKRAIFRSHHSNKKKLNPTAKSEKEMEYLQKALKSCFLFEDLTKVEQENLAKLFERCTLNKKN